ncbi:MAG: carbon-nitrogen hydrolase family protein [Lachnospiraceae bacterium]|nr:carbon-nitrogen hydrolase family protein [Lachnospiraceae bacterium]
MKVGIVQMPVFMDKVEDVEFAVKSIKKLSDKGADLIVLPEMFCCPYSNKYFRSYSEPEGGYVFTELSKAAAENNVYVVGGSMPEYDDDKIYNTSYVFDRKGNKIAKHRKMHLFDINVEGGQRFYESDTLSPGNSITLFDTEFGKIGLCICFDMRFPEIFRVMTLEGARAIIIPAAFNMTTGPAHWELTLRQRAIDAQLYTIAAAPARDDNGEYVSYGNSMITDPWGKVVFRAGAYEETGLVDLDMALVDKIRKQLPLLSARRTDVYRVERT